jgi:hypothetical protein
MLLNVDRLSSRVETLLLANGAVHELFERLATMVALHILVLAQLGVLAEELLVATFQQVALRVEQRRVPIRVEMPI